MNGFGSIVLTGYYLKMPEWRLLDNSINSDIMLRWLI